MRRTPFRVAAVVGLLVASAAGGQTPPPPVPQPRITAVFPPGAQAGSAVEVTVSGTDLDGVDRLLFAHPGITAEPVEGTGPKPAKPAKPDGKQPPPAAMKKGPVSVAVRFKVAVAAGVPLGQYDVRAVGRLGVSNPRAFVVGDRPEVNEAEPNDDAIAPESGMPVGGGMTVPSVRAGPTAQRVALGTTVNGVISSPTDVDYVVFSGTGGRRVLVSCLASSIDSRARPLVEVYDAAGKRVGMNRNYHGTDALADVTLPADGDYFVRVSEFAYQQGGPDFFYRLTVGTGPWVDAVFPPAVRPGKPTTVTLYGRNLPGGQAVPGMKVDGRPVESLAIPITPPADPGSLTRLAVRGRVAPAAALLDGFEFRLPSPAGASNGVPVFLTDAPVVAEKEKGNDRPEGAEPIPVPCEVAGRIDRRADRDFYSFAAKKGDVFTLELLADRIGGVPDLYLRVRDAKGGDLAGELDDDPRTLGVNFPTNSTDPPPHRFTAPADGTYLLLVGGYDSSVSFGPRCGYRLRVTAPAPDFRAVVLARQHELPTAAVLRRGGDAAYEVLVDRTGGFTGPVTVTVENLPPGVTATPALVGTGMPRGALILSATADAAEFTGPIAVTCSAAANGRTLTREARPASVTWGVPQPNVLTVSRLDQQLMLAVRPEPAPYRIAADPSAATVRGRDGADRPAQVSGGPVVVSPGDRLSLPVRVAWAGAGARPSATNLYLETTQATPQAGPLVAVNVPGSTGQNPQAAVVGPAETVGQVAIDVRSNAAPGTYAVVVRGETTIPFARDPAHPDQTAPATATTFTAPMPVIVRPTTLAKVAVRPPANNALRPGTTAPLVVTVDRQYDYAGSFAVAVRWPAGVTGLSAADVTLPAGADQASVPVTAAKDARPGGVPNVVVRVTGTVPGAGPVTTETKVTVTVAK